MVKVTKKAAEKIEEIIKNSDGEEKQVRLYLEGVG